RAGAQKARGQKRERQRERHAGGRRGKAADQVVGALLHPARAEQREHQRRKRGHGGQGEQHGRQRVVHARTSLCAAASPSSPKRAIRSRVMSRWLRNSTMTIARPTAASTAATPMESMYR